MTQSAFVAPTSTVSEPVLEWSHSRQNRYDACHRAHYYVERARHGSSPDATPLERTARRLKTLTALPLTIGSTLHDRASELVRAVRRNEPLPGLVPLRQRTAARLNAVWTSSSDRREQWMAHPTRVPMLSEWYYGRVPTRAELATVKTRIDEKLVTLRNLSLWAELGVCPPDDIMLVDKFESYVLIDLVGHDHVKVWSAPDLVMRLAPGKPWEVVDFKSGNVRSGEELARDIMQVTSYAVYLRHGVRVLAEGEHCRGRLVYLGDGTEVTFEIQACDITAAEYRIRDGARAMYAARVAGDAAAAAAAANALAAESSTDPAVITEIAERARRESPGYAMTTDGAKCRDCVFAEICGGPNVRAAGDNPASVDAAA